MQQNPGPPATVGAGMDKRTASLLSYLLLWVTGIIFLFVAKNDPDVKFHAARSVVIFLPMQILYWLAGLLPGPLGIIGTLIILAMVVTWIFCLYKAWTTNGSRFSIPVIGSLADNYAEQLAARV